MVRLPVYTQTAGNVSVHCPVLSSRT